MLRWGPSTRISKFALELGARADPHTWSGRVLDRPPLDATERSHRAARGLSELAALILFGRSLAGGAAAVAQGIACSTKLCGGGSPHCVLSPISTGCCAERLRAFSTSVSVQCSCTRRHGSSQ